MLNTILIRLFSMTGLLVVLLSAVGLAQNAVPNFRAQTIDNKVIIGYGTSIGDVNGDGKPDILLADKKQFVWYENPNWNRHVMAENLTENDNVCIAAHDIDGDGRVEVAVGAQWNPGDTLNSGSVHYLVAPADRTQMWTPVELPHEPVIHRMRWLKIGAEKYVLVVAPLHGRGNQNGAGAGAKLMAYHKPADPTQPWTVDVLDDEFHVTHNFDVTKWNPGDDSESILYLGQEGAKLIQNTGERWNSKRLANVKGGGEIRCGQLISGEKFITTIEPFHGNQLVVYEPSPSSTEPFSQRAVLDENLNQGHALAVADLMNNGSQQIVAGWREPNEERKFGIKLYYRVTEKADQGESSNWQSTFIDENEMACEDLRIAARNCSRCRNLPWVSLLNPFHRKTKLKCLPGRQKKLRVC